MRISVFDVNKIDDIRVKNAWKTFTASVPLSQEQEKQFARYLSLLLEWNERINLTAITDIPAIIDYHFQDSLQAAKEVDFTKIDGMIDVGTGAGLPGIPLKICYPHLNVFLIEVNSKKIAFLQEVIKELSMNSVEVYPFDWRTFLRKTTYQSDLICARASLKPAELIRMFKADSFYKNSQLIYWGAAHWQPGKKEQPFVEKEIMYTIGNKKRKLVFFNV